MVAPPLKSIRMKRVIGTGLTAAPMGGGSMSATALLTLSCPGHSLITKETARPPSAPRSSSLFPLMEKLEALCSAATYAAS